MGGRIFVIIFGAFMDPLLCIVMELHWEGSRGGGDYIPTFFLWGGGGVNTTLEQCPKRRLFFLSGRVSIEN